MTDFRIPSRFKLFGQTVEVVEDHGPFIAGERNDCVGFASYKLSRIELRPSADGQPRTKPQIEQTFFHELVHHIAYYAGDTVRLKGDEMLYRQEGFVDMFANLLHQALTTMEHDE